MVISYNYKPYITKVLRRDYKVGIDTALTLVILLSQGSPSQLTLLVNEVLFTRI